MRVISTFVDGRSGKAFPELKRCHICKEEKPRTPDFFHRHKNLPDGLSYKCKECYSAYHKKRYQRVAHRILQARKDNPGKYRGAVERARAARKVKRWSLHLFRNSQRSAKMGEWDHQITEEFIENLYEQQKGLCYYTGIPLVIGPEPRNLLYPSLDRIDSSVGYIPGNVVLCCLWVNLGKTNQSVESLLDALRKVDLENAPIARTVLS